MVFNDFRHFRHPTVQESLFYCINDSQTRTSPHYPRRVPVGTTVKKNYKKMPKIHKLNQTSSFLLWSDIISAPLLWKQRSEDSCLFSIFYIYFSKKCLFLVKKVKLTKISEIFVFNISSEPFKIFQKFQKAWIRWEHSFKMPYEGVQSDNK